MYTKYFSGTVFTLGILSHTFQINDALIGTIASVFDLLAAILYVFVSTAPQLYSGKFLTNLSYLCL